MIIKVLRNKEAKNIIFKFLLVQATIMALVFAWSNINKKLVIEDIINSKIEIAAIILEKYPELEDEIGRVVTGKPDEESFNGAKEILANQGYNLDVNISLDNTLQKVDRRNSTIFIIVTVMSILVGVSVLFMELNKIYGKIQKANDYIDNVLRDRVGEPLEHEGEGDFPILANELNKMVSVIKKDNELINKEKDNMKEFLTDISHQLKTPLTSISMITDILICKENISRDKQLEFLKNIEVQSDRMSWLIYNLLKIARLDAGTIQLDKDKVSVDMVLNSVKESVKVLLDEKNIKLNVSGNNVYFKGDEKWSGEAINNIVKNSIEHSKEGSRIDIIKEETLVYTRVIIKDYGQGIPKEELPNIFKRFYTRKGSSNKNIGVGLGLAKSIIEKQNGYIVVNSEEGKGTKFEITFIK